MYKFLTPFRLEPDEELLLFRHKSLIVLFAVWLGQSVLLLLWAFLTLLLFLWSVSLTGSLLELLNLVLRPIILISALTILLLWVKTPLQWFFHVYVVTTKRVFVQTGTIARTKREASLDKVQIVTALAGGLQKLLNVGHVRIETAGFMGAIDFALVSDPNTVQEIITEQLQQLRQRREMLQKDEIKTILDEHLNL